MRIFTNSHQKERILCEKLDEIGLDTLSVYTVNIIIKVHTCSFNSYTHTHTHTHTHTGGVGVVSYTDKTNNSLEINYIYSWANREHSGAEMKENAEGKKAQYLFLT
jgi:hypothetical protein